VLSSTPSVLAAAIVVGAADEDEVAVEDGAGEVLSTTLVSLVDASGVEEVGTGVEDEDGEVVEVVDVKNACVVSAAVLVASAASPSAASTTCSSTSNPTAQIHVRGVWRPGRGATIALVVFLLS
jgi:hypothetical protein